MHRFLINSTGGFRKKPRMSCIPVTEHHVFQFDFPESEESFDFEEDESSDHDDVGESDAEDEAWSSRKSSISCSFRPRIRCFAVRDFQPLLSGNPTDAPAEPHEEESEPEEDELDEGVDEAHMDISGEENDVDESPKVVDVVEVESQANFDVDSDQDGDFNADESEHANKVASSESSVKYITRPRCSTVRDFPPGLLQNPQPVTVREEEEVEPVEDDHSNYSEDTNESVVLDPSEDDSDETESDLKVDNNEDDEYQLVEPEDDETSDEYIESDDGADLSGYITCH